MMVTRVREEEMGNHLMGIGFCFFPLLLGTGTRTQYFMLARRVFLK